MLQVASQVGDESVKRMEASGEMNNPEAIALHRFQLAPKFEEKFDAGSRRLTLSSPYLSYEVSCQQPSDPAAIEAYLRYADAMCRLNYICTRAWCIRSRDWRSTIAGKRQMLPTEVRLRLNLAKPVSLRAEHKITWKLDKNDRRNISDWESMLDNKRIRHVKLQEYQQEVLGAMAKNQNSAATVSGRKKRAAPMVGRLGLPRSVPTSLPSALAYGVRPTVVGEFPVFFNFDAIQADSGLCGDVEGRARAWMEIRSEAGRTLHGSTLPQPRRKGGSSAHKKHPGPSEDRGAICKGTRRSFSYIPCCSHNCGTDNSCRFAR